MAYGQEVVGSRYGRLTVIDVLGSSSGQTVVTARCDCGAEVRAVMWRLTSGVKKSCGCLRKETVTARNTTHGLSHLPEYKVWVGVMTRCYNKRSISYKLYGAAGIGMSEDWRDSFESFYRDMGPRPSPDMSVERKDNKLGYSAENCVWATSETQNNNKSSNLNYTYEGVTQSLKKWAKAYGINYHCAYYRHSRGWGIERILTTKSRRKT